jgi:PadR family transcriptional regulator PadR
LDTARELLKGNTPTLVLAVLKVAPLHGYGIAREIERRSGNALKFKEGTLYPALHALEREGLITGQWHKEGNARERKVYTITPAGHAALDRRARTWTEFVTAIHKVMEGEPHVGTSGIPEGNRRRKPVGPMPDPIG